MQTHSRTYRNTLHAQKCEAQANPLFSKTGASPPTAESGTGGHVRENSKEISAIGAGSSAARGVTLVQPGVSL